eukprot:CAMPEP_0201567562 /NCGR_PEP_ID=MMETSP0190_2-20130828/8107_1 /ASSEMBLY_ACC=CAM_ASM_000263 /TAXON_ID=37353 /ORGANISM="Rosalina sp." /LENGTH=173 /DNA_ID=CAMNT_0047987695 /DNA_START=27 /DNA_END=548 /DNA_ORIENTATION=+
MAAVDEAKQEPKEQEQAKDNEDAKGDDKNENEPQNFTGIWELKTNDNLDAFMKSQGIGYMKRKLMSMASVTLTIDHQGDTMKVKAKLPIGEINEELPLDGTTKQTTNPMGDEIKMTASWKDDTKQVLIIKTDNLKTKKKVTMTRSMPDKDTLKDEMTNDQGISMTRNFKRKAQ